MRIRALDSGGDWTFGKGLNNYVVQDLAIAQNIRSRLLGWEGDCFFNLQDGLDWRYLLDKGKEEELKLAIKSNIIQAYGVVKVIEVTAVQDAARQMDISYSVETIYGTAFQATITQENIL